MAMFCGTRRWQGSRQDAITALEQGHILIAATATVGKCPWDSGGLDKAPHFTFLWGVSTPPSLFQFSPKGMAIISFPQGRKTSSVVKDGVISQGSHAAVRSTVPIASLPFLLLTPLASSLAVSFSFIAKMTKSTAIVETLENRVQRRK